MRVDLVIGWLFLVIAVTLGVLCALLLVGPYPQRNLYQHFAVGLLAVGAAGSVWLSNRSFARQERIDRSRTNTPPDSSVG